MNDSSNLDKTRNNQGESREVKINQGNYIETIQGDYKVEVNVISPPEAKPSLKQPSNLNKNGAANFVGREKQLKELHQLLQQNEQVSISAIAGMGGIGTADQGLLLQVHQPWWLWRKQARCHGKGGPFSTHHATDAAATDVESGPGTAVL